MAEQAANRSGLARIRPLTIKPVKITSDTKTKVSALPDGQYFNEPREEEFWRSIEKTEDVATTDLQRKALKQTEAVSDLQDTSGKIRLLVDKFDDIDQETLMTLMQIYDDGTGGAETMDQNMILNDSKTQVLDFLIQLNGLSDSQANLVETLKYWFNSLQQRSEENTVSDLEALPVVDDVISNLEQIVKDFAEKTEKVSCIHNDMIDFMYKQFAAFKRAVLQKDEEIRKLRKTIEDEAKAARRRAQKKQEEKPTEDSIRKEQFEAALRTNQELKSQIDQLRRALHETEVQRAALGAMKSDLTHSRELLETEANLNSLKLDSELNAQIMNQKIHDLESQMEKLRQQLKDTNEQKNYVIDDNKKKDKEIAELNLMVRRGINQLELERSKPKGSSRPVIDEEAFEKRAAEERAIMTMKHQDEIREIYAKNRQEMASQIEAMRQRYAKDRDDILKAVQNGDQSALLQSISNECERKIQEMQRENEEIKRNSLAELANRMSILTRQYEHRIKLLNETHENEISTLKESLQYEIKKRELDMEERLHNAVLKNNMEKEESIAEYKKHIDKLANALERKTSEAGKLREALQSMSEEHSVEMPEIEEVAILPSQTNSRPMTGDPDKIQQQYAYKLSVLKKEMEEQMNWALENQKKFYEKEMNNLVNNSQIDLRGHLMELQKSITELSSTSNDTTIMKSMDQIGKVFGQLNEQMDAIEEQPPVPTMPISEAADRTKVLTDRIIDLKMKMGSDDDKETIQRLTNEINIMKTLMNGDHEGALAKLAELEEQHKREMKEKDDMINEMLELSKAIDKSKMLSKFNYYIFDTYTEKTDMETEAIKVNEGLVVSNSLGVVDNAKIPTPSPTPKPEITDSSAQSDIPALDNLGTSPLILSMNQSMKNSARDETPPLNETDNHNFKLDIDIYQAYILNELPRDIVWKEGTENNEKEDNIRPNTPEETIKPTERNLSDMITSPNAMTPITTKRDDDRKRIDFGIQTLGNIQENKSMNTLTMAQISHVEALPLVRSFNISTNPNHIHVSPRPTQKPGLEISEKLENECEEKEGIRPMLSMRSYDSVFENEPIQKPKKEKKIQPSMSQADEICIPAFSSSLQITETEVNERAENEVVVVGKSPKASIEGCHIDSHLSELEIGLSKKVFVHRERSESVDTTVFKDESNQINKVLITEIPLKVLEKLERKIREIKKDIVIQNKETNMKPEVILIKDTDISEQPKRQQQIIIKDLGIPRIPTSSSLVNSQIQIDHASQLNIPLVEDYDREEKKQVKSKPVSEESSMLRLDQSRSTILQSSTISLFRELSLPGIDVKGDPYLAIQQIATSANRQLKQYLQDSEEILNGLGSDLSAYSAYIHMSGLTDQSHFSFIDNVKEAKTNYEEIQKVISVILNSATQIIKLNTKARDRYQKLEEELKEYRINNAAEEMKLQSELLDNITTNVDPHVPKSINQLETLHKLEAALDMLDKLGIEYGLDIVHKKQEIQSRIEQMKSELNVKGEVDQEVLDKLVADEQIFISSLPQASTQTMKETDIDAISPRKYDETVDSLKNDLKRIRKQRDYMRKDLKAERLKVEDLEQKLVLAQNRADENKEAREAELTAVKAEISNLREALGISSDDNGAANFRRQMLNMATMLDAANAEKSLLQSKVGELEDSLLLAQNHAKKLQNQVSELIDANFKAHNNSSLNVFQEVDLLREREEHQADVDIQEKTQQQLEETAAQNSLLIQRNGELEKQVLKLKSDLRNAKIQIDEMSINKQQAEPVKQVKKFDKATQKSEEVKIALPPKTPPKQSIQSDNDLLGALTLRDINMSSAAREQVIKHPNKTASSNTISSTQSFASTTESEDEIDSQVQSGMPSPKPQEEGTISLSEMNDSKINIGESRDVISSEIDFDVFEGEFKPRQEKTKSYLDDVALVVHDPLMIPKKPVKINLDEQLPTHTTRPKRPQRYRPGSTALVLPKIDTDFDMTIGGAVQGSRQISGAKGTFRPSQRDKHDGIQNLMNTTRSAASEIDQGIPILTSSMKLPSINTATTTACPSTSNLLDIMKVFQNGPKAIDKTLESDPVAPMRITLMVNNNQNEEKREKKPIIQPLPPLPEVRSSATALGATGQRAKDFDKDNKMVVLGQVIQKQVDSKELNDSLKLIAKLREQIRKQFDEKDKSDHLIVQLKQRISELTLELHRAKLDVIKSHDAMKRVQIRSDNVKSRLEICYREIGTRDDEIMRLKRDIMLLKSAAAPLNEAGTKLKFAASERERLKKERQRRNEMKELTQNALRSVTNPETAKHLTTLLANTENSLARIEMKRRMWAEIERKNTMAVLSAMSLLNDSATAEVKAVLPEYSPFNQTRVDTIKQLLDRNVHSSFIDDVQPLQDTQEMPPSYAEKLAAMSKLEPPLTDEEKRAVVLRRESEDVTRRLTELIRSENKRNSLSNTVITQSH